MKYRVEILENHSLYDGFLGLSRYRLRHTLFQGGLSPVIVRERIESYRAASVVLYDPDLDQVVLIEQFRIGALDHPRGAWVLEVIGGIIEQPEQPEEVARREAVEEAGCEIDQMEFICDFLVSPGFSTEHIYLFCGRVDSSSAGGIHGLEHEGEDIRVEVLTADQAFAELYQGRINSTNTIVAMQWLAMNRQRLREQWSGTPG